MVDPWFRKLLRTNRSRPVMKEDSRLNKIFLSDRVPGKVPDVTPVPGDEARQVGAILEFSGASAAF